MSKNRPVSPAEVLAPVAPPAPDVFAYRAPPAPIALDPRDLLAPQPAWDSPLPEVVTEEDFADLDGGAADAPELGNLDGSSTMVQGQVNVPPTEVPREFGKMSNTENAEPLNHQKTDRPPPGHSLHESAGVHPNEHHAGEPSFMDPDDPPPSPLSELEPPGQLTLPSLPEDPAAVFGEALVDLQESERRVLGIDHAGERVELEPLAVELINVLTRLASASGCNRPFIMAEWIRLGVHMLDGDFARTELRSTFETLEGVLTLMAAARNLRANLGSITGINVETLAGAFMSWMRPPPNPVPPRAQAPSAKAAPVAKAPAPAKAQAGPRPTSSDLPSAPTSAETPASKSHKKKEPGPFAPNPALDRELAKRRAEQEKEKQKAQKEREREQKAADAARAKRLRELDAERAKLEKAARKGK